MDYSTQGIYEERGTVYHCTISGGRVVLCGSKTDDCNPTFAILNRTIDETVDLVCYDMALDKRYFMREGFQPVDCGLSDFTIGIQLCLPLIQSGKIVVTNPEYLGNPAFWLAAYGQYLRLITTVK